MVVNVVCYNAIYQHTDAQIQTHRITRTSGSSPPATTTTVPVVSKPRRPARPAICVYSPGKMSLKERPSCFRMLENTTHLAGMLTPCNHLFCQTSQKHRRSPLPWQTFQLQIRLSPIPEQIISRLPDVDRLVVVTPGHGGLLL